MASHIPPLEPSYSMTYHVASEAIDQAGHVNNVVYVQWMQDVALAHANHVGGTAEMEKAGCAWVARSHSIDYLSPAFLGDEIKAITWVCYFRRIKSLRRYAFLRLSDSKLLARGETLWVCINAQTGKPSAVPQPVQDAFPVTGED